LKVSADAKIAMQCFEIFGWAYDPNASPWVRACWSPVVSTVCLRQSSTVINHITLSRTRRLVAMCWYQIFTSIFILN